MVQYTADPAFKCGKLLAAGSSTYFSLVLFIFPIIARGVFANAGGGKRLKSKQILKLVKMCRLQGYHTETYFINDKTLGSGLFCVLGYVG